jgi:hypothetical protein
MPDDRQSFAKVLRRSMRRLKHPKNLGFLGESRVDKDQGGFVPDI